jgi:hypothetical protein
MSIWSIKNRWLRAAVAWLALIAGCVALVPTLAALAVWSVVSGAAREVRDACTAFIGGVRDTASGGVATAAWAALTAKDEPV